MASITISITDTEEKCLDTLTKDVADHASLILKNRAREAQVDIIDKLVIHCNDNSIALAVGVDAQVTQAYTLGIAEKAKDLSKE